MIYFTIFITFLAGASCASSACLYLWLKQSEIERKLWTNKIVIREGSQRIFSDELIAAGITESGHAQVGRMKSPLKQEQDKLRSQVEEEKESRLPPQIKNAIDRRAEELNNNAN
jgi:hypothetical protein